MYKKGTSMVYYNHYNLDEIAEEMNAPHELYQTNFVDFPITIQDISNGPPPTQ